MIGTLILTHGGVARELLESARVIVGPMPGFEALSLDWGDCFEDAQRKIRGAVERLDQGEGVLILTDMFGGTPCNLAVKFQRAGKVEVSPQGKVALCAVATASGERPIRVLTVTDKKGIAAALAPKFKTPLQYSAAVSQAVAEALLDKCNVSPARVSAVGVPGEPSAGPKHDGKKLSGPRVELWLDSKG